MNSNQNDWTQAEISDSMFLPGEITVENHFVLKNFSIESLMRGIVEIKMHNGFPKLIKLGFKEKDSFEKYCQSQEIRNCECQAYKRNEFMGIEIQYFSVDSKFEIEYL